MTGISNESFESAMSVMATFRNVSGDTFKDSIMLAADMSQALGTDLQGSVIQLGKALNDPILGISALNRVGITFSKTQKEQIKKFIEANDLISAQAVMTKELTNQFGGQAVAQADSFGGAIGRLGEAWDDAKKGLGAYMFEHESFRNGLEDMILLVEHLTERLDAMWTRIALEMVSIPERWEQLGKTKFGKWMGEHFVDYLEPPVANDPRAVPFAKFSDFRAPTGDPSHGQLKRWSEHMNKAVAEKAAENLEIAKAAKKTEKETLTVREQIRVVLKKEAEENRKIWEEQREERRASREARRAAAMAAAAGAKLAAAAEKDKKVEDKKGKIAASKARKKWGELVRAGAAFNFREMAGLDKRGREQRRDARNRARQAFLRATVGIRPPRRDVREARDEARRQKYTEAQDKRQMRFGRARGTIEEQALQEQKKAAKKQANQERIQKQIAESLNSIHHLMAPQTVTNFN